MALLPSKQLIELIENHQSIVVFRHVNPDGDAYGSQWGLVQYLKDTYPEKNVYGVGQNNGSTRHLFPVPDLISDDTIRDSLVIVVDTSNKERIDDPRYVLGKSIVKIDHHPAVDDYAHFNLVNDSKSSACEMVTEFIRAATQDNPVSLACATYLFIGMKTDTLSFSTNKVNWQTLDNATYLLKSGPIDLAQLSDELMGVDDNIFDYVTYLRKNAVSDCEGQLIYVYIEPDIIEQYGLTSSTAKEYVNTFKQKKNAKAWAIFVNEGGTYNVSLRSRGFAINDIAAKYGGGGHAVAAATRNLTHPQTIDLLDDLKKRIQSSQ
ncbi:MAG: bifunctional oligoribonuclease/PAP phosphatase NrnA [Erysipelothrix sp.]|nr:bifunctional oligoribonuclease/PAP phosphatase NrnA [Erysipelothrix sp.]